MSELIDKLNKIFIIESEMATVDMSNEFNNNDYMGFLKLVCQKDMELQQPTKLIIQAIATDDTNSNNLKAVQLKSIRERRYHNFSKILTNILGTPEQLEKSRSDIANCLSSGVKWIDVNTGKRLAPGW